MNEENTTEIVNEKDIELGAAVSASQLNIGSLHEALRHAKITEVKLIGVNGTRRLWEPTGEAAGAKELILTDVRGHGWWRSGNAEFDEALKESGLQDRVKTRISFEADVSDSHWVHPSTPLQLQADCPHCGETATTGIEEDEYPDEVRTLYFDCENCRRDFNFAYCYKKVIYVIELPAAVTAVGDYKPADVS